MRTLQTDRLLNNRGMTLIEIMIVLIIIGGLMAILGRTVFSQFSSAQSKEAKIQVSEVTKSIELFYADCGFYPTTEGGLKSLIEAPSECKNWGPEPYIKKLPSDPWGSEFVYESKGSSYNLKSLGKDRKEGGSGADKDISSEDL